MTPNPEPEATLNATEAAEELGVSDQTVLNWLGRGAFPGAIRLGKTHRIPRVAVDRIKREGLDLSALSVPSPGAASGGAR